MIYIAELIMIWCVTVSLVAITIALIFWLLAVFIDWYRFG